MWRDARYGGEWREVSGVGMSSEKAEEAEEAEEAEAWMVGALGVCRAATGNFDVGEPASPVMVWVRYMLYAFSLLYPVFHVTVIEVVAAASGSAAAWDTYVGAVAFAVASVGQVCQEPCFRPGAGAVLRALADSAEAADAEALRRVGVERLPAPWPGRYARPPAWAVAAAIAMPQAVFGVYFYQFYFAPALASAQDEVAASTSLFMDTQWLAGPGREEAVLGALNGPQTLILFGVVHVFRTALVWLGFVELLLVCQAWVSANRMQCFTLRRTVRAVAHLSQDQWTVASMQRELDLLALALDGKQVRPGLGGAPPSAVGAAAAAAAAVASGQVSVTEMMSSAVQRSTSAILGSDVSGKLARVDAAFGLLQSGISSMNDVLTVPVLCGLLALFGFSVIGFNLGLTRGAPILVVVGTFCVAGTLALLAFMGGVGDAWISVQGEVRHVHVARALAETLGPEPASRLKESVAASSLGFEILHVVTSSQTIIYVLVYVSVVLVTSGVFTATGNNLDL